MLKCYLFTALPSLLPRPGFARAFMWSEATVAQSSESCVSISFFDRATLLTLPRYGRFALRSASLIAGLRPEAPSLHSTGALPPTPLQLRWRSPSFATSPFGACGILPEPVEAERASFGGSASPGPLRGRGCCTGSFGAPWSKLHVFALPD